MSTKDITTALSNLETSVSGKKSGPAKIALFPDVEKRRQEERKSLQVIPFNIEPEVDVATDVGGIPLGVIVELFGPESGGKSYLSLKLIASAQKLGLQACLIDAEHSFVRKWAESHGVDATQLMYGDDFEHGEEALQYVLGLVTKHTADVVVVDSVTALIPKAEIEAKLEDQQMGVQARMMSRALKQIMDEAAKNNVTVIFINQLREKIGVMFGDPETTPGGRALKFYASMRLRVGRISTEFENVGSDGNKRRIPISARSRLKVVKNKAGMPFQEAEFSIFFNPQNCSPEVQLINRAYDLRALQRKKDGSDKMVYVWGKGKDAEFTGCEDANSMSSWVDNNGKWGELSTIVREKATEKESLDAALEELLKKIGEKEPAKEVEEKVG